MVTSLLRIYHTPLWLFIILSMIQYSYQKRDFHFQIETLDVSTSNPDLCAVNSSITNKGDVKAVTGFLEVLHEVDHSGLSVELVARSVGSQKYITIVNQSIPDLCVYLKGNNPLNLVKFGMDELMKSGKIPGCPVEMGVYYIKNYYISPEYFPPIMPEAEWRATGKFFGNQHGKQIDCARFTVTGKLRKNSNSVWSKVKKPVTA